MSHPGAAGPRAPAAPARRRSTASTVAIVLAGLVLTAPFALSRVLELVVRAADPGGVDGADGLASLRPVLVATVALVVAAFVAAIVAAGIAARRDGRRAARPAWILVGAQAVLLVVILAATAGLDAMTGA